MGWIEKVVVGRGETRHNRAPVPYSMKEMLDELLKQINGNLGLMDKVTELKDIIRKTPDLTEE